VEHPIYQLESSRIKELKLDPTGDVEVPYVRCWKWRLDLLLPYGEGHRADDCREEGKLRHEESETDCLSAGPVQQQRTYGSSRAVYDEEGHDQLLTVEPPMSSAHSHFEVYWLL